MMRKLHTFVLLSGVVALGAAQPTMPAGPQGQSFDTRANGITQNLGTQVPTSTMWRNEAGQEVVLGDFVAKGRPILFVPIFYRCQGSCVLVLSGVVNALNGLKRDFPGQGFEVVTFSINPKEGPEDALKRKEEAMTAYRFANQGAKGWHFLTGDLESITALTTALGFRYVYNPYTERIDHPSGVMVTTPSGRISQYLYGVKYAPVEMERVLRQAREEMIGQAAPEVLFGCFVFDPNIGGYRLVVQRALQVGGIATVIALGLGILFMETRNRRAKARR